MPSFTALYERRQLKRTVNEGGAVVISHISLLPFVSITYAGSCTSRGASRGTVANACITALRTRWFLCLGNLHGNSCLLTHMIGETRSPTSDVSVTSGLCKHLRFSEWLLWRNGSQGRGFGVKCLPSCCSYWFLSLYLCFGPELIEKRVSLKIISFN